MRRGTATPVEVLVYLLGIVAGWQWGFFWADARRQIREANVSNFKAGDKVRVLHIGTGEHWVGREGILVTDTIGYYPWIVTGEAFNDEYGEGLAVNEHEIEHVGGEA